VLASSILIIKMPYWPTFVVYYHTFAVPKPGVQGVTGNEEFWDEMEAISALFAFLKHFKSYE
jgi:hypothetical protein